VKPYYEHGGITIYHGDCRDVLPGLSGVRLVMTDPPYGIAFAEYLSHTDSEDGYKDFVWPVIEGCERLLSDGWVCVFQAAKKCREWHEIFPREYRLIACPKTFVQMFKVTGPSWATDYALLWSIGAPTQKGKGRDWKVSKTSNFGGMGAERGHPCPRPLEQITYLVEILSEEGDTVLDPFMGSGTTLRAAKDLNRRAIGIEIEERYCEIAAKRLSQEVLFGLEEPA
jgi:site-specific DNA-methyltransferase (adenine-specific)